MIAVIPDTEIHVIINGKFSSGSVAWYLDRIGQKANLLDPKCSMVNEILDALSKEPLMIERIDKQYFLEIETNYSPRQKTNLIFCAPIGARLSLYAGGYVTVTTPSAMVGQQLRGMYGMYCAVNARKVTNKALQCNTTALSTVFLYDESIDRFYHGKDN